MNDGQEKTVENQRSNRQSEKYQCHSTGDDDRWSGGSDRFDLDRLGIGNERIVAEEIPEEKYGFKAAPEARSVAEMLTHIALVPQFFHQVHGIERRTSLDGSDFAATTRATLLTKAPYLVVVHPSFPGKSFADMIAYAKTAPLNFGVSGIGAALADTRPDVVLVPGWYSVTLVRALVWARAHGVPVIYRGDTNDATAPSGTTTVLATVDGEIGRAALGPSADLYRGEAFEALLARMKEHPCEIGRAHV